MLSVIIPVYNENEIFIELLKKVDQVPTNKEIIVVDDGSKNDPREHMQASGVSCKYFKHNENRGKGASLRTGISKASGQLIIFQDADLEYFPEDYEVLINAYNNNPDAVIYGKRDLSGRTYIMRWGNYFVTWLTNILFRGQVQDMETCYKLIPRDLINQLNLSSNGFDIEAEITAKLLRSGIQIIEIPIQYSHRVVGKKLSVLDGIPTVLTLIKVFIKFKKT